MLFIIEWHRLFFISTRNIHSDESRLTIYMPFRLKSCRLRRDQFYDFAGNLHLEAVIEDILKVSYTLVNRHIIALKEMNSDGIIRFYEKGGIKLIGIQEIKRNIKGDVALLRQFLQCLAYYIEWTTNYPNMIPITKFLILPTDTRISVFILPDDFRESHFFKILEHLYFDYKGTTVKGVKITPSTLYHVPLVNDLLFDYKENLLKGFKTFEIDEEKGLDFKVVVKYITDNCCS